LSLKNFTDGSAASRLSFSRIGIHTIEAQMSVSGNLLKISSCTARAPLSRHKGHVGESKAKNRILWILALNLSISGAIEFSIDIILLAWLSSLISKSL